MKIPKPMLPTLVFDIPIGDEWVYEIKYDGFRALLYIDHHSHSFISRNGISLSGSFPEVTQSLSKIREIWGDELPLLFDGELCLLDSPFKANFEQIQLRGRLKTIDKINDIMKTKKAHYCVFDLLSIHNQNLLDVRYDERKKKLQTLFTNANLPLEIDPVSPFFVQYIRSFHSVDEIWKITKRYDGEGIIAKHRSSKWSEGKRTTEWYKIKNWKESIFFITSYEKKNGYFHLGVLRNQTIYPIGLVSHGFSSEEREALLQVIKTNKSREDQHFIYVDPSICVEVAFLELYKEQLRQPNFNRFRLDVSWEECTWEKLQQQTHPLPEEVTITHPDKPLWPKKKISKQDYLHYLRDISPYMLPFLENRILTVIRYPHGMLGEPFYQKNCPDYAPDFIKTFESEGIEYIVCRDLETLTWLGNQLSFEFHIPFQTIYSTGPSEIVFDLDPPSREHFHLAVKAALLIKEVFDGLKLLSFIKTSGNKGLQIYVPLPDNTYTYEETRKFTEFIAHYLITKEPKLFTIERLKKNRGNRLYVDYIQHAEGKTIIAPYSVRGNEDALVATPLYWHEVKEDLSPEMFPLNQSKKRIERVGDPFQDYFKVKATQPFHDILLFLTQSS